MIKKLLTVFVCEGGVFFGSSMLQGAQLSALERVKFLSYLLRPGLVIYSIQDRGCLFVIDNTINNDDFKKVTKLIDARYHSDSTELKLACRVIKSVYPIAYGSLSLVAAGCNTCIDTLDGRFAGKTNTQRFLHHLFSLSLMPIVYNKAFDFIINKCKNAGIAGIVDNQKKLGFIVNYVLASSLDPYLWKTIELVTNFKTTSESENKKRVALSDDLELKRVS